MSNYELLWFIFFDELTATMIFPIAAKYVLKSALILNKDLVLHQALLIAFLGSLMGTLINYILK